MSWLLNVLIRSKTGIFNFFFKLCLELFHRLIITYFKKIIIISKWLFLRRFFSLLGIKKKFNKKNPLTLFSRTNRWDCEEDEISGKCPHCHKASTCHTVTDCHWRRLAADWGRAGGACTLLWLPPPAAEYQTPLIASLGT